MPSGESELRLSLEIGLGRVVTAGGLGRAVTASCPRLVSGESELRLTSEVGLGRVGTMSPI
jgi:hypothetical protein